jgi:hypothetical protein
MNQELLSLYDAITAIQIKVAALETMVLTNESLRSEYSRLVDVEAKKALVAKIANDSVC